MDVKNTAPARRKSGALRRILAIVLSIDAAGLGHFVMGHPRKGAVWFAGSLLLYGVFVASVVFGLLNYTFLLFVLLGSFRIVAIVDTIRTRVPAVAPRNMSTALVVIGMLALSSIVGLVGTRLARAYTMPTPSMSPSLEWGDHFLSSRILGKLERGQVIVFRYPPDPTKTYVKRLVGLPGDTIEVRDGALVLNGKPIERQRLSDSCDFETDCVVWQETIDGNTYKTVTAGYSASPPFGPAKVPDGQFFVLGDNRDNSADSRFWGYVPFDLVQAKPRIIYWSYGDGGIRWARIAQRVE